MQIDRWVDLARAGGSLLVGGILWSQAEMSWALPGQPAQVVAEWVQANPVLGATSSETLLVNRVQADGSRFSFQASVAPPGRIVNPLDRETIRSERMTFYNPAGLSAATLEQAVRDLYGEEITADLAAAVEVVRYPSPEVLNAPDTSENVLDKAIQGVVRQGAQYVYWFELTQNPDGLAQQGQVVLFQAEWLPKIQQELSERYTVVINSDGSLFPAPAPQDPAASPLPQLNESVE